MIQWKKRIRRYRRHGFAFERLESIDGTYTVGRVDSGLVDTTPTCHALCRVGRNERIIGSYTGVRGWDKAKRKCEDHESQHG